MEHEIKFCGNKNIKNNEILIKIFHSFHWNINTKETDGFVGRLHNA